MTQPTQAQIEAAAQAIIRCSGSPPPTDKIARYVADAALTAAAQVGECKTCGGRGYVVYDAEWEPYPVQCPDCKPAAQVGESRPFDVAYHFRKPTEAEAVKNIAEELNDEIEAAAQVGEPDRKKYLDRHIQAFARPIEDATIERCAQVAEQAGNHNYNDDDPNVQYAAGLDYAATAIAAAIRKLKDAP